MKKTTGKNRERNKNAEVGRSAALEKKPTAKNRIFY